MNLIRGLVACFIWGSCCFIIFGTTNTSANDAIVESEQLILQLKKKPIGKTRGFIVTAKESHTTPHEDLASATIYVFFISGTVIISDDHSQRQLDELGKALTSGALADGHFEIRGHTDSVGSEAYNMRLSKKRALAVNDYLKQTYGYSCTSIKGYGESQPLASNDTPEGRAKNRRVVIVRLD